jgi:phage gp36-like protein
MSWLAITADEIKTRLSGPEAEALQSSALATDQVDPLPDVISQVTDEVRGYVAAHNANTLGPAGTLPPQVRAAAIAIIRWRLSGRLAIGKAAQLLQSESRRQEYEDAVSFLKDVAAGKVAIETPDVTGPETIPQVEGAWGSNEKIDFNV